MSKALVVETIKSSDRNIVMHFKHNKLTAINFWQGDFDLDLLRTYAEPNLGLHKYLYHKFINTEWWDNYEEFNYLHNSPDYYDILEWIDKTIWEHLKVIDRIAELEIELKQLKLFINK
jgi:hypothetical protein